MMSGNGTKFRVDHYHEMEQLRQMIEYCQMADHVQQVAYSTYHDALTQICFKCQIIRTTLLKSDIK